MRTNLIVLLSLGLLFGLTGCAPKAVSQSDLDTPEYHFRLGVRSMNNGDYETALTAFQRAVDLDRKFARGWSGLGLTKAYLGNSAEGKDDVDKGISLASKDEVVWIFRGRFWTVSRDRRNWLEKAEDDFRRALSLDPGNEAAEYYLGEAYFYSLNFQGAEAQFAKVVSLKGELAGKADEMWSLSQKIVRARPGTEAGRQIAIKPEITRADLAVLFAEELKLAEIFERLAPPSGQPAFQPPSAMTTADQRTVPADVAGQWAEPWIMEVLDLGVFEVDPSGNFFPSQTVMRVDYAMAIQRILITATRDASLETRYFGESPSRFGDVPSSHFAYNAMALCAERGIMQADLMSGRFDPAGKVTGADALLIIREIQSSLRITF
ncbi:MAG: tetratricopeptide repeat protein [Fidelibacterota bacterium]|nr:MAG: tetratricopeptide repeat protein [Candidatus Neomarinimicrobiota bacterium]